MLLRPVTYFVGRRPYKSYSILTSKPKALFHPTTYFVEARPFPNSKTKPGKPSSVGPKSA